MTCTVQNYVMHVCVLLNEVVCLSHAYMCTSSWPILIHACLKFLFN